MSNPLEEKAKAYANDMTNKGQCPRYVINPGLYCGYVAGYLAKEAETAPLKLNCTMLHQLYKLFTDKFR